MTAEPSNDPQPTGQPVTLLSTLSDESLIEGHAIGTDGYFLELVRRYQDSLLRLIVRMVGDQSEAQDVLQEVLLQAHLAAKQFDPTRRAKPWLFTIAANRARDFLRKRKRIAAESIDAEAPSGRGTMVDLLATRLPGPADLAERADTIKALKKAIKHLPAGQAAVIELAFFQQMPYQEISEILTIPLGTVKSRVHAAVAFLANELKSSNRTTKPS